MPDRKTLPEQVVIDVFASDWEGCMYVGAQHTRSEALTIGAQELAEARSQCKVRRIWMCRLQGEAALDASGGEFEDYFVEVARDHKYAIPMWRVDTRS